MEIASSLPCSQDPATGFYTETDEAHTFHPIFLRSILILS
jgi:hypothetical protein